MIRAGGHVRMDGCPSGASSPRDELLAGTMPRQNETVELWMNHTFPNGVTLASAWETMPLHSAEAP